MITYSLTRTTVSVNTVIFSRKPTSDLFIFSSHPSTLPVGYTYPAALLNNLTVLPDLTLISCFVLVVMCTIHSIFFSAIGLRNPFVWRNAISCALNLQKTSSLHETWCFSTVELCFRTQSIFMWKWIFYSLSNQLLCNLLKYPTTPHLHSTKLCGEALSSSVIAFLQPLHLVILQVT